MINKVTSKPPKGMVTFKSGNMFKKFMLNIKNRFTELQQYITS